MNRKQIAAFCRDKATKHRRESERARGWCKKDWHTAKAEAYEAVVKKIDQILHGVVLK